MAQVTRHYHWGQRTPSISDRKEAGWRPHTIVMENLPTYADIQQVLLNFVSSGQLAAEFKPVVGVSITHPNDQFCKKEGLKLAKSRMKEVSLEIDHLAIEPDNGDIKLVLTHDDALVYFTYKKSGAIYIEHIGVQEFYDLVK